MRRPTLDCPHAEYREEMRVYCRKAETYCGNAYFRACRGWWALTERAAACPLRKEDGHGEERPAGAGDRI